MTKKLFILFLICFPFFLEAQYTDIINSNRPGFSESPYSVGSGVYQLETSLFFRRAEAIPTFSNPQALGLNLHFRTSFFLEKLELNINTNVQRDKIAFSNVFESSYNQMGLGEFTLGGKYLVFEPKYADKSKEIRSWKKRHAFDFKRWIPNIAVYAGVNFDLILNNYHRRGSAVTPKFGVLLQNNFSNRFNVISNFYYNYIGSNLSEFSYIITATHTFSDEWSGFAEHQALFNSQEKQSNLGGGIAYLFSKDLQVNASLRTTFQESTVGVYASVGASYRIDNHEDDFVELDEFGNKIENDKESYNKGFFGRIFDKIKNIFNKKEKNKVDKDTDIAKENEEEETPTTGRKRPKSVLDDLIKEDKKDKKKKTKAEKKAERKKQKAKEREKRRREKDRAREKRRKQKEEEKLQKEIRKLEKELKEEN